MARKPAGPRTPVTIFTRTCYCLDAHDKITEERVRALHQGLTMVSGTRLSEGVGPSGGRVEKKEEKRGDLSTLGMVQTSEQYE